MADEDLQDNPDPARLALILEAARDFEPVVAEAARRALILARLWFRSIEDRRESIDDAHGGTFEWALAPNPWRERGSLQWDDLAAWLSSGS